MKTIVLSSVLIASLVSVATAAPDLSKLPPAAKKEGLTYAKDIRPIFEASCFRCHGNERPKAGLKLVTLDDVLKGSKEGKVVVPGKSAESTLVIAVARIDDEIAMPPKPRGGRGKGPGGNRSGTASSGTNQPSGPGKGGMGPMPKPLTPEQVGLVRAWVDQGAK